MNALSTVVFQESEQGMLSNSVSRTPLSPIIMLGGWHQATFHTEYQPCSRSNDEMHAAMVDDAVQHYGPEVSVHVRTAVTVLLRRFPHGDATRSEISRKCQTVQQSQSFTWEMNIWV